MNFKGIKLNFWQTFLFISGIFLICAGIFLIVDPHFYFCRVKNKPVNKNSLYCLINKARVKRGLNPLTRNSKLEMIADLRAKEIVVYNNFSHKPFNGERFIDIAIENGYRAQIMGEVLARRFDTTSEIFDAWMRSASHSAVILNPKYQDIGISIWDSVIVGLMGRE
jgi:uncharacterized protein YkwD